MSDQSTAQNEQVWQSLPDQAKAAIFDANIAAQDILEFGERHRWLAIGKGRAVIRDEALRLAATNNLQHPLYRFYQGMLLAKADHLAELEKRDHASCQHALWLHDMWPEIAPWLMKLDSETKGTRKLLNHPSTIKRRFEGTNKRPKQPSAEEIKAGDKLQASPPTDPAKLMRQLARLYVDAPFAERAETLRQIAHMLRVHIQGELIEAPALSEPEMAEGLHQIITRAEARQAPSILDHAFASLDAPRKRGKRGKA